jgi:hypothetical protein
MHFMVGAADDYHAKTTPAGSLVFVGPSYSAESNVTEVMAAGCGMLVNTSSGKLLPLNDTETLCETLRSKNNGSGVGAMHFPIRHLFSNWLKFCLGVCLVLFIVASIGVYRARRAGGGAQFNSRDCLPEPCISQLLVDLQCHGGRDD